MRSSDLNRLAPGAGARHATVFRRRAILVLAVGWCALAAPCAAVWAQNDTGPMVRLLASGRLPEERLGTVLNVIFQRGAAADLAYVYDRALRPDGFPPPVRLQALGGLATALETRKVQPTVDPQPLVALLTADDRALQLAAIRLAAALRAEPAVAPLHAIALDVRSSDALRRSALSALLRIGGAAARPTIDELLQSPRPALRDLGIAALVSLDREQAAVRAAAVLAAAPADYDPGTLVDAFLDRQSGAERLAAALADVKLAPDVAKLAMRRMYAAGRSDPALVDVLGKAAGISSEPTTLTAEQLRALSAEVLAKGDPARGESIFRRADLGCTKCHATSGAGGDVGPDLSPLGATSPVDYVITSLLNPDLSIKEVFLTRSFATDDGRIFQGIVVDRDDQRVVVKDATGARVTIPVDDIADEVEGKSLMPKGLPNLMTAAEFLDLARFLSELGKPGPYEVRSQPTIQRWRYLTNLPDQWSESLPDRDAWQQLLQPGRADDWLPVYARTAGDLPLDELPARAGAPLFLYGEVDVTQPGEVEIKLDDPAGVALWIDGEPLPAASPLVARLENGTHKVLLRVDRTRREKRTLRVLVERAPSHSAVFTVVGGR